MCDGVNLCFVGIVTYVDAWDAIGKCDKLLICKKEDYDYRKVKKIIKDNFPELVKNFFGIKWFSNTKLIVGDCCDFCLDDFDEKVAEVKTNNDWEENPFVVIGLAHECVV